MSQVSRSTRPLAVAAMSGGVDSAVAAALLVEKGYDVVGITLQLYDHGVGVRSGGTCCAGRDINDARRVAQHLGIPHYVLDYETRFREAVIDDFADTYLAGETPVPCVRCNQQVKFRDLLSAARDLGAEMLATGHYVRRVDGARGAELHMAEDASRDQSYFLFATTPQQLSFLRFPLGAMRKEETRATAARLGLPIAAKPDSQDICFVPSGDYAAVVKRLRPDADRPGEIIHVDGRVLGRHAGVVHFTVGQRRGLKIGGGAPLYVLRLDPDTSQVIVGPREALGVMRFSVGDLNWLGGLIPAEGVHAQVRVRSTRPPKPAMVFAGAAGGADVVLDVPEEGVAPGQACVVYEGTRVLGGGWIRRPTSPADDAHAPTVAVSGSALESALAAPGPTTPTLVTG